MSGSSCAIRIAVRRTLPIRPSEMIQETRSYQRAHRRMVWPIVNGVVSMGASPSVRHVTILLDTLNLRFPIYAGPAPARASREAV